MKLKPRPSDKFYAALQAAGMPEVPGEFSVAQQHQVISSAILAEISDFIHAFDRVTAREAWQTAALCEAPAIVQLRRPEVCFFSAWDFHLPPGGGWQLIEFNDNGSGFIFAAIIGSKTASGEKFDGHELTAAHRTLPFGTQVRVTNVSNGRSVTVRINDRGPFVRGRVVDVSYLAAKTLGMTGRGIAKVKLDVVQ